MADEFAFSHRQADHLTLREGFFPAVLAGGIHGEMFRVVSLISFCDARSVGRLYHGQGRGDGVFSRGALK